MNNQISTNRQSAILAGKTAIILGAGGSIGSAVAKEFAAEGSEVFLIGRTQSKLDALVAEIERSGGKAHAKSLDALDDIAVNSYFDEVAKRAGRLDIVFNAVGPLANEYGNTKSATQLTIEEYMLPLNTMVKAQFISARAAVRHMEAQKSGVVIFLTGSPARGHVPGATAIGTAFGAIETLMENLALEIGPSGVRAVCLRTTANVDSRSIQDTMAAIAQYSGASQEQLVEAMGNFNFLKSPATTADTSRAAVLLASDSARMLTGTVVNATAGAALD